jgi:exodeoxyribonuclease VII large subunit
MPSTDFLRLSELNTRVSSAVSDTFPLPCWVVAEVAEVKPNGSGHTYFSLVEKQGETVLAEARATLWKPRRPQLAVFQKLVGKPFSRGMEVLLLVQAVFHPRYGFSLDVKEIDGRYTLGDMARRRAEVIERLTEENLLHRNKRLSLSPVPQRVAVISSASAAGYQDFTERLACNPHGYAFSCELFPAFMQGDGSEDSILSAMASVRAELSRFDVLVIIRGGGAIVDLSCFDGYPLARAIAEFPMPVITGIGHEKDESVADLVSFHKAATPTAAAEYLISRVREYEEELEDLASIVVERSTGGVRAQLVELDRLMVRFILAAQKEIGREGDVLNGLARRAGTSVRSSSEKRKQALTELATRLSLLPSMRLQQEKAGVEVLERGLAAGANRMLEKSQSELALLEKDVRSRDPADVLRRGYSITRVNGRAIRDAADVEPGARIETTLYQGSIESTVEAVETTEMEG